MFISALTPLACSHPILFNAHLERMLGFLPALVLPPQGDCGPTPTVGRPFPAGGGASSGPSAPAGRQGAFVFPPPSGSLGGNGGDDDDSPADHNEREHEDLDDEDDDAQLQLRLTALEFMLSLAESRPSMVKQSAPGWAAVVVRACLEGMGMGEDGSSGGGGAAEEEDTLNTWRGEDVSLISRSRLRLVLLEKWADEIDLRL